METVRKIFAAKTGNFYWDLFMCFFKMGLFTIGGGMVMIPILQEKMCEEYKWLTVEEALDAIAVSQSLPGVIAINLATYVGYKKKGLPGSICATVGVILPSFIVIILVVCLLRTIEENPYVQGTLEGIKAAATGLIAFAAYKLGRQTVKKPFQWIMAGAAFAAIGILGFSAVWVIIAGIFAGEIYYFLRGSREAADASGDGPGGEY